MKIVRQVKGPFAFIANESEERPHPTPLGSILGVSYDTSLSATVFHLRVAPENKLPASETPAAVFMGLPRRLA